MSISMVTVSDTAKDIVEKMQVGDVQGVQTGIESVCTLATQKAMDSLKADFAAYQESHDDAILAQRGIRKLTSKEKNFYNKMIDAMKSGNPKQAFIDIITDSEEAMPQTIIEDVMRGITQEHPLLSKIDFQTVGYLTHWILNDHTTQPATWGAITDAIATEITSGINVVDLKQNKLSCYAILEQGMVDLGPEWLDSYVRAVLTESMAYALETAVISGDGSNCPVGMAMDLTTETGGAYSAKTATAVTDFKPATYGPILATLSQDENGNPRKIQPALIVNQTTYYEKILPATVVLASNGTYVETAFPVATEVIISNAVADGYAILGDPKYYFLAIGESARNNVIQYSDEYRFIEDQRVFKVVYYADGRAVDNNSFAYLDVSGLEELIIPVETVSTTTAG